MMKTLPSEPRNERLLKLIVINIYLNQEYDASLKDTSKVTKELIKNIRNC